jgi:hypothetical protein
MRHEFIKQTQLQVTGLILTPVPCCGAWDDDPEGILLSYARDFFKRKESDARAELVELWVFGRSGKEVPEVSSWMGGN